jgi:hypothetical protein
MTVRDKQVVELLGRNRLVDELLRAGLEVAFPLRDRGIDLIAYADKGQGVQTFVAKPIQMKAAFVRSFGIDRKYAAFPSLILAYVWYVEDADKTMTCALAYRDAVSVAELMGYTKSPSWRKGRYDRTRVGGRLLKMLEGHQMTADKWRAIVIGTPDA